MFDFFLVSIQQLGSSVIKYISNINIRLYLASIFPNKPKLDTSPSTPSTTNQPGYSKSSLSGPRTSIPSSTGPPTQSPNIRAASSSTSLRGTQSFAARPNPQSESPPSRTSDTYYNSQPRILSSTSLRDTRSSAARPNPQPETSGLNSLANIVSSQLRTWNAPAAPPKYESSHNNASLFSDHDDDPLNPNNLKKR